MLSEYTLKEAVPQMGVAAKPAWVSLLGKLVGGILLKWCLTPFVFLLLTIFISNSVFALCENAGDGYTSCTFNSQTGSPAVIRAMVELGAHEQYPNDTFCWDNLPPGSEFRYGPTTSSVCGGWGRMYCTDYNPALCKPSKNLGDDSCTKSMSGNPVNNANGNKAQREFDYQSGGASLELSRLYNSRSSDLTITAGSLWSNSYLKSIGETPGPYDALTKNYIANRGDGRVMMFSLSNGVWNHDADIADQLEKITDASGTLIGWRYTVAADDSVETYSATGKLLTIADRAGRTQTLTYNLPAASGGDDDPETLDAVTDATGRQLRFSYDTQNRIATVSDPAGGIISYGYDAQSNLVSVTYPDGHSKTYHYNEPEHTVGANLPHALTGITDENGDRYATYAYDATGKAISTGHAGGAGLHTLAYSPNGTTVTDPLGTARTYSFQTILGVVKSTGQSQPGGSGCGPASSATTYDANGNVASRADFNGHKTCYAYDLARNLETARVEALASATACPSNPATYTPAAGTAQRKILTEWHPSFRLPVKITEAGRETSFVYDAHGNVTSNTIKDTILNTARTWTTTYTYHASVPGVLVQKVENGPRTDVSDLTTTAYYAPDAACTGGHFGCRAQVESVTNALGHITHITRYNAHGQPEVIIDPNGLVTTLAYDARQRLLSRTAGTETTGFEYDAAGQLSKLTRPDGSYLSYSHDPAHRLTQIADNLGNRIANTLDAMGNRTREDVFDPANTLAQTRQHEYDALNRLWKDLGAQSQTTQYAYDAQGNLTQVTDPLLHSTASSYDALDRLIQINDPAGGQTRQTHDVLDRVVSVTDPKGIATTYTWNGLGDLTREVSADRGTLNYSYDSAGNLNIQTDARGIITSYSHDALNRPTHAAYADGTATDYQYDSGSNGLGRLSRLVDPGVSTAWSYDTQGRVTQKQQTLGWLTQSLLYAYDSSGRLTQMTTPSGKLVAYSYSQGRISRLTVNGQIVMDTIQYRPDGQVKSWTWGNGTGYARQFDLDGRVSAYPVGSLNRTLGYDAASRITGYTHAGQPAYDQHFGYDGLDRLTGFSSNPGAESYQYDANGNRTQTTLDANNYPYTYPTASNRLTSVAGPVSKTYSYDAAGNATADGGKTFVYDARGRLVEVRSGQTVIATYTYNGLGQRVRKSGTSWYFMHDEAGHLVGEYNPNGVLVQETVWLDDTPVAVLKGTSVYYVQADHLNAPRVITDSQNRIVWRWDNAGPFGVGAPNENPSGLGAFSYNLRLPGQYYDQETGLHYNTFRDYEPRTGRYVQGDPIGLLGGLNLYAYVSNNPISLNDPTGLTPSFGQCLGRCAANQFGLTAAGVGAVAAGIPIQALKPVGALGSSPGASIGSTVLSKLVPVRLPFSIPTPTFANPAARTALLGRALGRFVPVVGVGLLAFDATSIALCVDSCLNEEDCQSTGQSQ